MRNYCQSLVDLSSSYEAVVPERVRQRYSWAETRSAAAILAATNPQQFAQLVAVLDRFAVDEERDIRPAGGNESDTAAVLNEGFRSLGWREGDYNVRVISLLRRLPYSPAGERSPVEEETVISSPSYLVDNISARVALDVEWHAKDGNLDRDLAAYRSLYESGIIDVAVMVTMVRSEMREWAVRLDPNSTKFKTTTTTNLEKLIPRLTRGDSGGCPVLVVAISSATR